MKAALLQILAQWAGFGSSGEMEEVTELLYRGPDRNWYVTNLPCGQWIVWDDFTYHIHARSHSYKDVVQAGRRLLTMAS